MTPRGQRRQRRKALQRTRRGKNRRLGAAHQFERQARRHRGLGAYALGRRTRTQRGERASHHDSSGTISLVHNGIIENYSVLKRRSKSWGQFRPTPTPKCWSSWSATFTREISKTPAPGLEARRGHLRHRRHLRQRAGKIVVARNGSRSCSASAKMRLRRLRRGRILHHTRQVIYLDDPEMLSSSATNSHHGLDKRIRDQEYRGDLLESLPAIEKWRIHHFMLKEIFEQARDGDERDARALREVTPCPHNWRANMTDEDNRAIQRIILMACDVVSCRAHRRIHDRETARIPRGRVRLRVPLSQSDRYPGHAVHRDQPVRRDAGHAVGDARSEDEARARSAFAMWSAPPSRANRRRRIHARRAGNRRRLGRRRSPRSSWCWRSVTLKSGALRTDGPRGSRDFIHERRASRTDPTDFSIAMPR